MTWSKARVTGYGDSLSLGKSSAGSLLEYHSARSWRGEDDVGDAEQAGWGQGYNTCTKRVSVLRRVKACPGDKCRSWAADGLGISARDSLPGNGISAMCRHLSEFPRNLCV